MRLLSAGRLGHRICTTNGGEEAERASCVRVKMETERRRDAESERKRCKARQGFSGGDGRKGGAEEISSWRAELS